MQLQAPKRPIQGIMVGKRMGSGRMLSWLGHGSPAEADGVRVGAIMLGTWVLCESG